MARRIKGSATKRVARGGATGLAEAYVNGCEAGDSVDEAVVSSLKSGVLRFEARCEARLVRPVARFLESDAARKDLKRIIIFGNGADTTLKEQKLMLKLCRGAGAAVASGAVEVFEMTGNVPGLTPKSLRELGKGLGAARMLRYASFRNVDLGDSGLAALAPGLRACPCTYLALRGCRLTAASSSLVASVVRAHGARRDEAVWACNLRKRVASREPTKEIRELGVVAFDLGDNQLLRKDDVLNVLRADEWVFGVLFDEMNATTAGRARLIDQASSLDACHVDILRGWEACPALGLSMELATSGRMDGSPAETLCRLVVDNGACPSGRAASAADLDRGLLAARVKCHAARERRASREAARRVLARDASLASAIKLTNAAVGLDDVEDAVVDALVRRSRYETLESIATATDTDEPSEAVCQAADDLDAWMRRNRWRAADLFAAASHKKGAVSALDLKDALSLPTTASDEEDPIVIFAKRRQEERTRSSPDDVEPQQSFTSYLFGLAGARETLGNLGLEAALLAAKRLGRANQDAARGVLSARRLGRRLGGRQDKFFAGLAHEDGHVSLARLRQGVKSIFGEIDSTAFAARLMRYASDDSNVSVETLVAACARALDDNDSLARVSHGARVLDVEKLAAKFKWTTSELARQASSKRRSGGSLDVTERELSDFFAAHGIDDGPPNLDNEDALARVFTNKPEARVITPSASSTEDDDQPPTIDDVLSFARRVATEDGGQISIESFEDAIRAYRRGAAGKARVRRASQNLDALREDLGRRGVELSAWLAAAADRLEGRRRLGIDEIRRGLTALLGQREVGLVEAGLEALCLFAQASVDVPVPLADLRTAEGRSRELDEDDLVDLLHPGDLDHANVAGKIHSMLVDHEWAITDILDAIKPFDDRNFASPRALCRALKAWKIFVPATKAQERHFDHMIGKPPAATASLQTKPKNAKRVAPKRRTVYPSTTPPAPIVVKKKKKTKVVVKKDKDLQVLVRFLFAPVMTFLCRPRSSAPCRPWFRASPTSNTASILPETILLYFNEPRRRGRYRERAEQSHPREPCRLDEHRSHRPCSAKSTESREQTRAATRGQFLANRRWRRSTRGRTLRT